MIEIEQLKKYYGSNKAIDIDAFDPVLWLNLGKEYMLDGNLEESVKALQYAHTLDPESRTINGLLGAALARTENNFEAARQDFLRRFDDFSVRALEQFFLDRFRESQRFATLGAWWDRRGNNEIDLIAQDNADNIWFFEVKRNALKYNRKTFEAKVSAFVQNNPTVRKCRLYVRGLSTQDMTTDVSTLLQTAELLVLPT